MNRHTFFALLVVAGIVVIVIAGLLPTDVPASDSGVAASVATVDTVGQGACAFVPAPPAARAARAARRPQLKLGEKRDLGWSGPPIRIADWIEPSSELLVVAQSAVPGREIVALFNPRSSALRTLSERTVAQSLPMWSARAQALDEKKDQGFAALAQSHDPEAASAAYVNPELQIAAEPNGDRFIAWTSFGARFVDTPNAIECDLVVNRVEGRPDRPLIDVKWSRDGRFVALLMLADFDRLGPTVLRILDVQKGVWHDVAVGELAVSSVTWVPGRSVALVTAADLGAADGMDVMFVVDAESGAVARVDNAPVLFTPAYWGVRFSPDGTQLAASCVVPDPDGVVRRGSLCAWEVALP